MEITKSAPQKRSKFIQSIFMKIYFAGSIRGGREDKALYGEIIGLLSKYGLVLTEHISSKDLTETGEALPSDAIYKRDIDWLNEADVVVAETTTPSLGVGYEVAKAEIMNKKILCLFRPHNDKKLSAMIGGNPNIIKTEYATLNDLERIFHDFFKS